MSRLTPYVGQQDDHDGRAPAEGFAWGKGLRMAISFERGQFLRIAALAQRRKCSFAAVVRSLVAEALERETSR